MTATVIEFVPGRSAGAQADPPHAGDDGLGRRHRQEPGVAELFERLARTIGSEYMAFRRAVAGTEALAERLPVARVQRRGWAQRGSCYGLPAALMFPESVSEIPAAVEVCDGCRSTLSCLAAARQDEAWSDEPASTTFGVRGGLTAAHRTRIYRTIGAAP